METLLLTFGFFIAVVFVVVNLLVDVVYMIINPRVSYDSKGGN